MAQDIYGSELRPNDKVIWHMRGELPRVGFVYTVENVKSPEKKIKFREVEGEYFAYNCLKVLSPLDNKINYELVAAKLIELINSQPRSPRKDEIMEVLKNATS